MFEGLKEIAENVGNELREKEDNGWSRRELDNYRKGYDNAFFDVARALCENDYLLVSEKEHLEEIFDNSLNKVGML